MTGMEIEFNLVDDDGRPVAEERRGARGDREPELPDRAGAVQPRDQRAAAPARLARGLRLRGRPAQQPQPRRGQGQRGPRPHGDDRHPADPRGRPPEPVERQPQPALQAAQRPDPRGPRRGPRHRHQRAPSGCRRPRTRSCRRRPARAPSCTPRSARTTSRRTGTPPRRSAASSSRSAPTRRTSSASSCGRRPGSRCSSRPPTPAARSSRSRACGPGCGSASAGSTRSSTCSRRTCATSRRCCRSPTTRTRWRCSRAAARPTLSELKLHNGTIYRWNRPVYDVVDGVPHLRVENRVLAAGPDASSTRWPTRPSTSG